MNDKSNLSVPEPIVQLQRQLDQFRSAQPHRAKIPEGLWQAAVELARQHGLYAVAHPLRLDYEGLKRRLEGVEPASCVAGSGAMIHITAQMRVLVAIEAVDGRKGIDSLVRVCQEKLSEDPITGCVFVFRSRRGTSIRLLSYDGQGYWLAQKRLSQGRFRWWPESNSPAKALESYEAQLLAGGRSARKTSYIYAR